MKHYLSLLFILLCALCYSQNHDAQWTVGSPIAKIDFRISDTIIVDTLQLKIGTTQTHANICDENGDLLYFTNGIYIADKYGDTILNGYGLNPCFYTSLFTAIGLNIQQAALFLPYPANPRYYFLIHFSNDTLNDSRPKTVYYTLIDKEGNLGLGEVTEKNVPILDHVILRGGGMTACKHANGRDYWIIILGRSLNTFYKFLLTPSGFFGPYTQNIGGFYPGAFDVAYSKFSPDGTKYATGAYSGYVTVLDFDRCTGNFSNAILLHNEASLDPINHSESGCSSLEFSPNSRFLYVSTRLSIRQYDLWTTAIATSKDIYIADSLDSAQVHYLQLAPNGKMYVSTWGGGVKALHQINTPDEVGDSCGFIYAGQYVPTLNAVNLSNMIHYKLGPLAGSSCDTITTNINEQTTAGNLLHIQPNPADKFLYVEMAMRGGYIIQLFNSNGQLVDTRNTRQIDIFNTENLPAGNYFLKIADKNSEKIITSTQVIVTH